MADQKQEKAGTSATTGQGSSDGGTEPSPTVATSPRVAVITIHGVASHQVGDNLRVTTEMLAREFPDAYSPTSETRRLLNVTPVPITQEAGASVSDLSLDLTRELLADYEEKSGYEVICRKTVRTDIDKPGKSCRVDLYEMYWDDLSHLAPGFLGVIGELFHLFFELPRIGVRTIDAAIKSDTMPRKQWGIYAHVASITAGFLRIVLPFLHVLMFAVLSVLVPLAMPPDIQRIVAVGIIPVGLLLLLGTQLPKTSSSHWSPGRLLLLTTVICTSLAVLLWSVISDKNSNITGTLALECWGVAAILFFLGVRAFSVRHPIFHNERTILNAEQANTKKESTAQENTGQGNTEKNTEKEEQEKENTEKAGKPLPLGVFLASLVPIFALVITGIFIGYGCGGYCASDYGSSGKLVFTMGRERIVELALRLLEVLFTIGYASWGFFAIMLTILVLPWVGTALPAFWKSAKSPGTKVPRVLTTTVISFAVPAALFFLLTLTLWSGVTAALGVVSLPSSPFRLIPADPGSTITKPGGTSTSDAPPMKYHPFLFTSPGPCSYLDDPEIIEQTVSNGVAVKACKADARAYLRALLYSSGGPFLQTAVLFLALALGVVLWVMWPSVVQEQNPYFPEKAKAESVLLGNWLTRGSRAGWVALAFVASVMTVLFLFGFALRGAHFIYGRHGEPLPTWLTDISSFLYQTSSPLLLWLGSGIATSAITLTTLGSRLDTFSGGFRQATEVIFDVFQHLRDRPIGKTPRARIAARYASLLGYLCQNPNKEHQYDAVIIVAHSQGATITLDILRFLEMEAKKTPPQPLRSETWPERLLNGMRTRGKQQPIKFPAFYLISFGCPLRQLYSLRFPDLYDWGRHADAKQPKPGETPERKPDPNTVGVEKWINLFHSGDYVGRFLWTGEPDRQATDQDWAAVWEFDDLRLFWDGKAEERCLGAGAHTRYWSPQSPILARELDDLIARIHVDGSLAPKPAPAASQKLPTEPS